MRSAKAKRGVARRSGHPRSLFFKLFMAFLLVVSAAFMVEAWFAIMKGRGTMGRLVEDDLRGRAQDVLEEVDQYLAGRGREVELWSGLSVMNDITTPGGVRSAQDFLETLHRQRSDQYEALLVLDESGKVLASTETKGIGTVVSLTEAAPHPVPGTTMRIGAIQGISGGGNRTMVLAHPMSRHSRSGTMSWLVTWIRWEPVEEIVSRAKVGRGEQNSGRFLLLVDHEGRVIAGSPSFIDHLPEAIVKLGRLRPGDSTKRTLIVDEYLLAESQLDHPEAPIEPLRTVAFWKTSEAYAVVKIFVATVLGSAILGIALAAVASFLVARAITRRLGRLMEGTNRLSMGEMDYRVEEGPNDEIGRLARSFNVMGAEIARSKEGLEAAVARWRALVTHAPDAIMTVDRQGTIHFANTPVTGLSPERAVGRSLFAHVPEEHREPLSAALDCVWETGRAVSLDLETNGSSRGAQWHSVRIGPVERDGTVVAATIITTDITPRKRLEREILEVSELERNRIGQDLHDGLGQLLTGTALLSKGLQQTLMGQSRPEAADAGRIKDLIGAAIDQTRALAKGLFPIDLQGEGLRGALEDLAAGVDRMFRVSCRVEGVLEAPPLDHGKATHLFRIAQEAVSNSIRHGHARRIIIELSSAQGGNLIRIEDDGVGIGGAASTREGMGMRSMKYRANVIGATIEIGPAPQRGTVVTCRFPGRSEARRDA